MKQKITKRTKRNKGESSSLSLEEKLSLLYGDGYWNIRGIPRLGLSSLRMKDGPLGLRNIDDDNKLSKESICYPAPCLTACSFDKDLLFRIGAMLGKECKHNQVDMLLSPGVNIKRNPLCGRNFEYFSEDPFLTGKLASSFIKGIQSEGVGSCLKHFACNSQEYYRMVNDSIVDDRALFELYLKPFEIAVKESSPWAVMSSYNKINGEYACESTLLSSVLKGDWGYKGVVISDWGGTSDYVLSHNKGLDVEMPCFLNRNKELSKAYKKGILKKEVVEDSSNRIISLLQKAKENKNRIDDFSIEEARNLALEAATKSMVLLKNEGVLPLKSLSSCCLIGELARSLRYQGGGSSKVLSAKPVSFLDALLNYSKKKIPFAAGYNLNKKSDSDLTLEAIDLAAKYKNVILFLGLPMQEESEGFDRANLQLPENQLRLFDSIYSVNQNIIVVLSCGSPVELPFKVKTKAILLSYLPGEKGGEAIRKVLLGEVSPSGRLAESWPIHLIDVPSFGFYPGTETQSIYRESIYVGYRYYLSAKKDVNFPFGHGLSYAKFKYGKLSLSKKTIDKNEKISATIEVSNISKIDSELSICLYVSPIKGNVFKPLRYLADFSKLSLKGKETKTFSFEISYDCFSFYDKDKKKFLVEGGDYLIQVCTSCIDIKSEAEINVKSNEQFASKLTSIPVYYLPRKEGFLQYDNDFENLLGHTIPWVKDPKSKPYTLNSTLGDIEGTFIGKKMLKIGLKTLTKGEKDPNYSIMENTLKQTPIRNIVIEKGVKEKTVYLVLYFANGQYLKGILGYLFGYKKNAY